MPNASAKGVMTYLRIKGSKKAKDIQKIRVEEWLDNNIDEVSFSERR